MSEHERRRWRVFWKVVRPFPDDEYSEYVAHPERSAMTEEQLRRQLKRTRAQQHGECLELLDYQRGKLQALHEEFSASWGYDAWPFEELDSQSEDEAANVQASEEEEEEEDEENRTTPSDNDIPLHSNQTVAANEHRPSARLSASNTGSADGPSRDSTPYTNGHLVADSAVNGIHSETGAPIDEDTAMQQQPPYDDSDGSDEFYDTYEDMYETRNGSASAPPPPPPPVYTPAERRTLRRNRAAVYQKLNAAYLNWRDTLQRSQFTTFHFLRSLQQNEMMTLWQQRAQGERIWSHVAWRGLLTKGSTAYRVRALTRDPFPIPSLTAGVDILSLRQRCQLAEAALMLSLPNARFFLIQFDNEPPPPTAALPTPADYSEANEVLYERQIVRFLHDHLYSAIVPLPDNGKLHLLPASKIDVPATCPPALWQHLKRSATITLLAIYTAPNRGDYPAVVPPPPSSHPSMFDDRSERSIDVDGRNNHDTDDDEDERSEGPVLGNMDHFLVNPDQDWPSAENDHPSAYHQYQQQQQQQQQQGTPSYPTAHLPHKAELARRIFQAAAEHPERWMSLLPSQDTSIAEMDEL